MRIVRWSFPFGLAHDVSYLYLGLGVTQTNLAASNQVHGRGQVGLCGGMPRLGREDKGSIKDEEDNYVSLDGASEDAVLLTATSYVSRTK